MNYSKAIDTKLKYRESLLADYAVELKAARAATEAIRTRRNAAIQESNFKDAAKLERDLIASQAAEADAQRAIELAADNTSIPGDLIRQEFRVIAEQHTKELNKLKEASDKALAVYVKTLQDIATFQLEGRTKARTWDALMRSEHPTTGGNTCAPIFDLGDTKNVKGLYEFNKGKLNI